MTTATDIERPRFARMYLKASERMERRGATEHRRTLLDGLAGRVVELGAGNGLNFPVPDQARALAELHRVVRPAGELRFYEHVIANCQPMRTILRLADGSGLWPKLAGGCHPHATPAPPSKPPGSRSSGASDSDSRRARSSQASPTSSAPPGGSDRRTTFPVLICPEFVRSRGRDAWSGAVDGPSHGGDLCDAPEPETADHMRTTRTGRVRR